MVLKRITTALLIILLCVVAFVIAFKAYIDFVPDGQGRDYPVGISDFKDTGEYRIDPKTALFNLQNGKTDILSPVLATPEVYTPLDNGSSYLWGFSDYRKVSAVLWQLAWGDDMKAWNIFGMDYLADCQDPLKGFSTGDFVYFKSMKTQQGNTYAGREILISPMYGDITWGSGTSYPRPLFGWKEIKLEDIKITPDDVLRIAEENGGREARLAVKNACTLALIYSPNNRSDNWNFTITHKNELPYLFEINIDPYTGKFKVVKPSN